MPKQDSLATASLCQQHECLTTLPTPNFRDLVFCQGHLRSCTFLLEQPDMLSKSPEAHGQQSLFPRKMEAADSLESVVAHPSALYTQGES